MQAALDRPHRAVERLSNFVQAQAAQVMHHHHYPLVDRQAPDGGLEIRYRDRVMRWTEVTGRPRGEPRPCPDLPRVIRLKPRRVCDDHPWRRGPDQHRLDQQLAADRKAYAAVNP